MMQLLSHPFSPYGRKVALAMALKGVADRIEVIHVDTNPLDNPDIVRANPLGKIPALVVDGDTAIFDSHVICEYLDSLAPAPALLPKGGMERMRTLTLASLADGILDAALLLVYEERFRPEDKWHQPWQARQQLKIDRAVDLLERRRPSGRRAQTTATSRSPAPLATSTSVTRANGAPGPPRPGGMARRVRHDSPRVRSNAAQKLEL